MLFGLYGRNSATRPATTITTNSTSSAMTSRGSFSRRPAIRSAAAPLGRGVPQRHAGSVAGTRRPQLGQGQVVAMARQNLTPSPSRNSGWRVASYFAVM